MSVRNWLSLSLASWKGQYLIVTVRMNEYSVLAQRALVGLHSHLISRLVLAGILALSDGTLSTRIALWTLFVKQPPQDGVQTKNTSRRTTLSHNWGTFFMDEMHNVMSVVLIPLFQVNIIKAVFCSIWRLDAIPEGCLTKKQLLSEHPHAYLHACSVTSDWALRKKRKPQDVVFIT